MGNDRSFEIVIADCDFKGEKQDGGARRFAGAELWCFVCVWAEGRGNAKSVSVDRFFQLALRICVLDVFVKHFSIFCVLECSLWWWQGVLMLFLEFGFVECLGV